ncbi:MAG: rhodanese-like domain-containing protein [Cyanobacteria bacterium P01_D01_bin.36]
MQITNNSVLIAILALFLFVPLVACRQQGNTAADSVQATAVSVVESEQSSMLQTLESRWIIGADEARSQIEQGATVLDARTGIHFGKIKGAVPISWKTFSPTDPATRGNLLEDDTQLREQLEALGISNSKPVVVFGNAPRGWGEDGRIVWMLRSLGHTQAVMVDGGYQALIDAGVNATVLSEETNNRFEVRRNSRWSITKEALKSQLGSNNLVVIDTRELREFAGSTPYGEQRGGHIPGAIHLYFKDFLDDDGKLLPQQTILNKLETLSISTDQQIVVYCTGGIRSGWLVAVLTTLGFQVQNYAGSMWEWSAAPADDYPLETSQ